MIRSAIHLPLLLALFFSGCGDSPQSGGTEVVATSSLPAPGEVRVVSVTPVPDEVVSISTESFLTDPSAWKWRVPFPGTFVPDRGAVFVTERGGPGPEYAGPPLDVSAVTAIRVRLAAQSNRSGDKPVAIPWVAFYWARSEDVARDDWPFSNERRVVLLKATEDPADPLWIGRLQGHPLWNGRLEKAFVATNFTKDPDFVETGAGATQFTVAVQSIDLARTRPQRNWRP